MKRYADHRHYFPSCNHSPIGLVHSSYRSELPYIILSSIKHRDPNVTVESGNDLRDVALVSRSSYDLLQHSEGCDHFTTRLNLAKFHFVTRNGYV
jgi:hypothetical protein